MSATVIGHADDTEQGFHCFCKGDLVDFFLGSNRSDGMFFFLFFEVLFGLEYSFYEDIFFAFDTKLLHDLYDRFCASFFEFKVDLHSCDGVNIADIFFKALDPTRF